MNDVSLSVYHPHLLTLCVSYKAERASTVVLTKEQVCAFRSALAALELQMEPEEARADECGERLSRAA